MGAEGAGAWEACKDVRGKAALLVSQDLNLPLAQPRTASHTPTPGAGTQPGGGWDPGPEEGGIQLEDSGTPAQRRVGPGLEEGVPSWQTVDLLTNSLRASRKRPEPVSSKICKV